RGARRALRDTWRRPQAVLGFRPRDPSSGDCCHTARRIRRRSPAATAARDPTSARSVPSLRLRRCLAPRHVARRVGSHPRPPPRLAGRARNLAWARGPDRAIAYRRYRATRAHTGGGVDARRSNPRSAAGVAVLSPPGIDAAALLATRELHIYDTSPQHVGLDTRPSLFGRVPMNRRRFLEQSA